jgi:hypothetical protein
MPEPMIKGAVIRDFIEWYGAQRGADDVRRLGQRLPPDLQAMIDLDDHGFKLLGSSWYPARLVHAILDAHAMERTPEEMARFLHDANRGFIKTGAAKSVYRFFLRKLVTPEMYALCVPRFWKQWHSTGERRVKIIGRGLAESFVFNWAGHHPHLCTMTIETMCAVFETMGCKNVSWDRVECVSKGAPHCKTIVTWT